MATLKRTLCGKTMHKPILVLQMQRMGDLIMTFPLLALLQKKYPQHPIWTVAEQEFFSELMPFAPRTTFFPPSAISRLQNAEFHTVINVSTVPKAADFAGSLRTEHIIGPHIRKNAAYIAGSWSLYRASIVENNRYNLFHWADLQLLDHIDTAKLPPMYCNNTLRKSFEAERTHAKQPKVGIFVGASETEKRPTPAFFAKIAQALLRKNCQPLFLGGPNDKAFGLEAAALSGLKGASLCGAFTLGKLAGVMATLDLCITPDTGPMHLAAWTNTPVLNISLGPVNPYETGPMFTGHHIVSPKLSCTGCWKACKKPERCQNTLHANAIALLAHTLIHHPENIAKIHLPSMHLYTTQRHANGLYALQKIQKGEHAASLSAREHMAAFWQAWFWQSLQNPQDVQAQKNTEMRLQHVREHHEPLYMYLHKAVAHMGTSLRKHILDMRKGHAHELPKDFWQKQPTPIRPLSGHMHLYLQNEEYTPKAWAKVLQDMERVALLFTK